MVRCTLRNGATFGWGCYGECIHSLDCQRLRVYIVFLPRTLPLVRAVCIWWVREIFILVGKVVEEEGGRVVREGNGRDKGRIAHNFGNLRDRRRRKVAVARHDRRSV